MEKNKINNWLFVLIVVIIVGIIGIVSAMESSKPVEIDAQDENTFAIEVYNLINEYDANADSSALSDPYYSKRIIVKSVGDDLDLTKYGAKVVVKGPDHLYALQFESAEKAKTACDKISKLDGAEYCEPDYYIQGADETNGNGAYSWGVEQIGADKYAEYVGSVTDSSVIVAVVDSGIYENSFLKGRIAEGGKDFVRYDYTPDDELGHGTHIAGTIVDCTPGLDIKILPVKVLNENNMGSNLMISLGIRYAVEQGAQIMNLSLGCKVICQTLDNAVIYALNQGCVVVVSAGNDNQDTVTYSPAHLDECIVVSAVDNKEEKADFSNWGESIDFAAPGVDIVSCVPLNLLASGKLNGEEFQSWKGTSMAAPHITALAAMLKLQDSSLSPDEIYDAIKSNCVDLGDSGKDMYYGWGIPDFHNYSEKMQVLKLNDWEKGEVSEDSVVYGLTWNKIPGASGYEIEYSWKESNGIWYTSVVYKGNEEFRYKYPLSYRALSVRVRSYIERDGKKEYGEWSEEKYIDISDEVPNTNTENLEAPTLSEWYQKEAITDCVTYEISWNKIPDADGYEIEYSVKDDDNDWFTVKSIWNKISDIDGYKTEDFFKDKSNNWIAFESSVEIEEKFSDSFSYINQILKIRIRAFSDSSGERKYSEWSEEKYIEVVGGYPK